MLKLISVGHQPGWREFRTFATHQSGGILTGKLDGPFSDWEEYLQFRNLTGFDRRERIIISLFCGPELWLR